MTRYQAEAIANMNRLKNLSII